MGGTIQLGGIDYPLVAGAYTRFDATGGPHLQSGRLAITEFGGGQRQAVAGEPDRSWDGAGVRAIFAGLGVEPWPAQTDYSDTTMAGGSGAFPSPTRRAHFAALGNFVYIGMGRRLYKTVSMNAGTWIDLDFVADMGGGAEISDLFATDSNDLIVGLGQATDAKKYDVQSGTLLTFITGEKIDQGISYGCQVLYAPKVSGGSGGRNGRLVITLTKFNGATTYDERFLDAAIVKLGSHRGQAVIATRKSLFLFGGQPDPGAADDAGIVGDQSKPTVWRGDPEPIFSHGEYAAPGDFLFLTRFRGKLWSWLAGRVISWDGTATGWKAEPVTGTICYGAAAAGGYLVVALAKADSTKELWAYDGTEWWRIATYGSGQLARLWPVALYGAGSHNLLVFQDNTSTYQLYRFESASASKAPYQAAGEWVSSLLDAGTTEAKRWRAVGCTFASPDPRANAAGSADTVTVKLLYSTDGGVSFTEAASSTIAPAAGRVLTLTADLSSVTSRYLQLKVTWASVLDWAPVLQSVWSDWTILTVPPPKRRWEATVRCSDLAVDGDGQPWPNDGAAIAAGLWTAWESGTVLPFRDLDFAANPTERSVRIGQITETVERGGDRAH